jgi:hypothetical protein
MTHSQAFKVSINEWATQINHAVALFLESQLVGVVSPGESFGVVRLTETWIRYMS